MVGVAQQGEAEGILGIEFLLRRRFVGADPKGADPGRLEISLRYETPRDQLDAFVTRLRAVYLAQPAADATTGYVGLRSFGESALTIELWGYFNLADYDGYIAARHRLIGDIVDLARSLDVGFAYPTRAIRLLSEEDGNTEDEQKALNPA